VPWWSRGRGEIGQLGLSEAGSNTGRVRHAGPGQVLRSESDRTSENGGRVVSRCAKWISAVARPVQACFFPAAMSDPFAMVQAEQITSMRVVR
jgi:hypothetical protein